MVSLVYRGGRYLACCNANLASYAYLKRYNINLKSNVINARQKVDTHFTVSPTEASQRKENTVLRIVRLSHNATIPTKASAKAAGYDLYSAHDCCIAPMDKAVVRTDVQIAVPAGCYGRVAPRSGLAADHFIDVGAGVIDEDYRGNVGVVLFNFNKKPYHVKKGDRIAQLICERICHPEVEQHEALDDTARGAGGFGSTGNN